MPIDRSVIRVKAMLVAPNADRTAHAVSLVGGLALLPVALVVEGAPPAVDLPAALGYAWIAIAGTGLA